MSKATAVTLIFLFTVSFVCAQNGTTLDASLDAVAGSNVKDLVKPLADSVSSTAPEQATLTNIVPSVPPVPGSGQLGGPVPKQEMEKNGSTFVLASSVLIALSVVLCLTN